MIRGKGDRLLSSVGSQMVLVGLETVGEDEVQIYTGFAFPQCEGKCENKVYKRLGFAFYLTHYIDV